MKTIRSHFIRGKLTLENSNTLFLKSQSKKEKELDIHREERVFSELLELKRNFQHRWTQLLSFVAFFKCLHLKFALKRKNNLLAEIFLQKIVNTIFLLNNQTKFLGPTIT